MTTPDAMDPMRETLERLTTGDRSAALCLLAASQAADPTGRASFHDLAITYRDDHLASWAAEGRDVAAEAGRLSLDEVRAHLADVVLPRLAAAGAVAVDGEGDATTVTLLDPLLGWHHTLGPTLHAALTTMREAGGPRRTAEVAVAARSVLAADGLVKTYRGRHVVNQVRLELRQGEIVGLLGPN